MKHFFIIPNKNKEETLCFAERLCACILERGGSCETAGSLDFDGGHYVHPSDIPPDTEAVITLGGDGTIIQAARDTEDLGLPILGVNMGTLGFLAETDSGHASAALDRLMSDEYLIEERMMIRGSVVRSGEVIYENSALNDIVLRVAGFSTIEFDFCVNNELIKQYRGDGMILSTPTGSTAYNLSAGGPIVMPSASLILATPLNPHTMLKRSIVLPEDVRISLRVSGERSEEALVSFDGTVYPGIHRGDEIRVMKDEKKVRLLKLEKDSFLEVLRNKLE